jgi:hypothetical protein
MSRHKKKYICPCINNVCIVYPNLSSLSIPPAFYFPLLQTTKIDSPTAGEPRCNLRQALFKKNTYQNLLIPNIVWNWTRMPIFLVLAPMACLCICPTSLHLEIHKKNKRTLVSPATRRRLLHPPLSKGRLAKKKGPNGGGGLLDKGSFGQVLPDRRETVWGLNAYK